jgi:hypothetical protein
LLYDFFAKPLLRVPNVTLILLLPDNFTAIYEKNITGELDECKDALVIFIFNIVPAGKNKCPSPPAGIKLFPAKSFSPVKSATWGNVLITEPEANAKHPIKDPVID